jgi:hypothetical protein
LAVAATRAVSQTVSSPRQREGPKQQQLHAGGEDRVARLDGELAIPELMRGLPGDWGCGRRGGSFASDLGSEVSAWLGW